MVGKRVDTSQADIVEALRKVGAVWHDCTQQRPSLGYDGIAIYGGRVWFVEIKSPGKWKFTVKELEVQSMYSRGGITVWVWECAEDALKTLGVL